MSGSMALTGFLILAKDLLADAKAQGVTVGEIELWVREDDGTKGFFVGDTASLPGRGWTKLAVL
jgi:hypothetical protein